MQTSISWQESNNGINSKTYSSLEAEIVYEINQARFKNKEFIEEIISQIMENNDPSTKTINLKEINKVIHYYDESLLQSFYKYIEENIKTFQFLEEFTFLKEINRKFCDLFKDEIKKAKKIGLYPINKKNFHTLKTEIFSEAYYAYYIENITLKNIKLILLLIILEEFIILNRKSQMNSQDILPNIQIENDESIKIDTICFLTNNFSTLCINLDEIAKETNNNIKAYNIYLLLLSKDYFERNEDQDIEKIQSQSPMTTLPKKKFLHLQKKYDKIYIPNMQIPKKAIQKLILTMDSDNDFKVTLQDIILFSQKHYIYFEKEFFEKVFLEAASKRTGADNPSKVRNLTKINPLTFEEIQYAMRMTLLRQGNTWIEHYRPYRDIWLLFLERLGETNLIRKSLPELNIQEIPEQGSNFNCHKNNTSNYRMKTQNLKSMSFQQSYRPEANLIVNNTMYIKEIVSEINNPEDLTPNPFEKVINKEFHYLENASSVGFDTKLYYEEALKLSNSPEKYVKSNKNPILTYVPEKLASEKFTEKFTEKFKLQKTRSHQALLTPEENLSYHTHGKIDFDLENITEKMDNCGSSIQNLAMSLAFTEKLSKTKNSILFPLPTISTGDNLSKSKKINKSISAQGFDSKLFISATKVEDCPTLKKKLARLEPILDKYKQPIDHVFRDETNNNFKKPYKLSFKCNALENPYHINSYYLNPSDKEILAQKNEEIILENEKKKYEKYFTKRPRWINYHTRANLIRKEGFIDHKPPDFLRKGNYIEPFEIHVNLYRDDDHFDELFKLYHKPLKAIEKFQYLGQPIKKELSLKQSTN